MIRYFIYIIVILTYPSLTYALDNALQEGGFYLGQTSPENRITFQNNSIIVGDDGYFFIGFHRDEDEEQFFTEITPNGARTTHKLTIKKRYYNEQRIYGVAKKYVTPPDHVLYRIKVDKKNVTQARAIFSNLPYYRQHYIWPVHGTITGHFGVARFFNDQARSPHYGIDIAAPKGTKVRAPNSGIVTLNDNLYYSGHTIIIDHGFGVMSSLLHLDSSFVTIGDRVQKGDVIGTVGSSGRSTGAHLDWRINWGNKRLDAAFFVPAMPQ